jgi:hypothetical protein
LGVSPVPAALTYWWLAPLFAALGFAAVLWFNWGQHKFRAWRMKRRIDVYLTAASSGALGSGASYEFHVQPNAEVSIQLRLKPRFHYRQHGIIFGFRGKPDEKPEPLKYLNTFVARGLKREQSPDTHDNQFVDYNGSYHLQEARELVTATDYSLGFVVRTKKPGRYPIVFIARTDCGEARPIHDLFLTVEDRPVRSPKPPKRQPRRSSPKAAS